MLSLFTSRAPTATSSKFWGVSWQKSRRQWKAYYKDAEGKKRYIGLYDTQEAAAHAVNAAIRRAGLEGKRPTNPVVDGQLVPRETPSGNRGGGKRRREEPAAAASARRRATPAVGDRVTLTLDDAEGSVVKIGGGRLPFHVEFDDGDVDVFRASELRVL